MTMETIEVRYRPIILTVGIFYHKYIVYTDSSGSQYAARGGPSSGIFDSASGAGFGYIKTEVETFDQNFIDHHNNSHRIGLGYPDASETIATGTDLSAQWNSIVQTMNDINAAGYQYEAMGQNSNAVVDNALSYAGLPAAQLDDVGENTSPGSDTPLTDHIPNLDQNGDGRADAPLPHKYPPLPGHKPDHQASPLVLDLDGDGIEHYAAGAYGTYFDLRNNGQAVLTGWVDPDDGLLVIDTNNNGVIDNGSELFGTETTDGFSVLKNYDSNNDGIMNASDTAFDSLKVWTDTNSDGFSQSNELHTLASLGITSINLDARRLSGEAVDGNSTTHESTFTINGAQQKIVDIWFGYDAMQTKNATDYTFDIRAAYLPTLKGAGDIKDLHIASSIDNGAGATTLMEQMMAFAANRTLAGSMVNWTATQTSVENIMLRWAGVDTVAANSRGSYVDARYLAFYEKFRGEAFDQYGRSNPLPEAGAYVNDIFKFVVLWEGIQLLAQTSGQDIFDGSKYNAVTGAIEGDLDLKSSGVAAIASAAATHMNGADVWAHFAQFLAYTKGFSTLTPAEITMLDTAVASSNIVGLDNWQDVTTHMTATMGAIKETADDWGSYEMFYDLKVNGTAANDVLEDTIIGTYLNNQLAGGDGDDILRGFSGHDKLIGGAGADRLEGGAGDDLLLGGMGDDTYVYDGGNDTVSEENGGGFDTLLIASSTGLTEANLTDLYRYGDNLIVVLSNGNTITIDKYAQSEHGIEIIKFEATNYTIDLTALTQQKFYGTTHEDKITVMGENYQTMSVYGDAGNDVLKATSGAALFYGGDGYDTLIGGNQNDTLYGENQDDYLLGGNGNDSLYGGSGNDTLDGGAGNDLLDGGSGNNTYLFGVGSGTDTVTRQSNIGNTTNTSKIVFLDGISTNNITIDRTPGAYTLDDVTFSTSSGDKLVVDDMFAKNGQYLYLIKQFQFANGVVWDENDVITQYLNQHTTSGNDTIYGFERDDSFQSSAGNDYIAGYSGSDTYRWGIGSGQDTIMDQVVNYNNGADNDKIIIEGALTASDVTFSKNSNHLVVQSNSTLDSLTIQNFFNSSGLFRIESVEFASGSPTLSYSDIYTMTIGGSVITGTDSAETLTGNSGNNVIDGQGGDDTLKGLDGDDTLNGGNGDDRLEGGNGADIYVANSGIDTIYEQAGNDTIQFGPGITLADLDIYRRYDGMFDEHLMITWAGGSIKVDQQFYDLSTDRRVERVLFDDGSTYDLVTNNFVTKGSSVADTIVGEKYSLFGHDDTIYGYGGNDNIDGDLGNDIIYGGDGDDIIRGKTGNDTLYGNDGDDTIYEIYGGTDIIDGGLGIDTLDYSGASTYRVTVNLELGTQSDTYTTPSNDTISNIENVIGGSGNDTLTGNSLNNTLSGGNGNDTIYGRAGSDTLYGGNGVDTLYGEDDNDYIYGGASADILYGGLGADTFVFESVNAFSSIDMIKDFNTSQGDKINIHDIISGYDPVTSAITDFIEITTSGSNSIVKVDRDGAATTYGWTQIATLEGITGLTDETALLNAGHIVA